MLAAALASGIGAAFQFIQGLKQGRQADGIDPGPRPVYKTPDAVNQGVAIGQNAANSAMPGFGQNLARLGANTASTIRAARDSGSSNNALAVIAAAGENQNNATNSLYTQNGQFQRMGQQMLLGQLSQKAGYEDKEFAINKQKPYEDAVRAKAALTQASATNMNSGLAGFGAAATMGFRGSDFGQNAAQDYDQYGAMVPRQAQLQVPAFKWPAMPTGR